MNWRRIPSFWSRFSRFTSNVGASLLLDHCLMPWRKETRFPGIL
uniref:Uncharacterized protein n=1 Tax=Arundo donax TaxID=35708 RepID=A0A0A9HQP8_ARUDO